MNVLIVGFGWERWEGDGQAREKPSKDEDGKKPTRVLQIYFLLPIFSVQANNHFIWKGDVGGPSSGWRMNGSQPPLLPQMPPIPVLVSETHLGLRNLIDCDLGVNLFEY